MATLGEYSSLLQLGFGIGIGLSIFRAPMDLMSKAFEKDLNAELDVISEIQTPRAVSMRGRLSDVKLEFAQTSKTLNRFHFPFMIASIICAAVNWSLLAKASSHAGYLLTDGEEWLVWLVSGPVFLILAVILAAFTWRDLKPLRNKLNVIRSL